MHTSTSHYLSANSKLNNGSGVRALHGPATCGVDFFLVEQSAVGGVEINAAPSHDSLTWTEGMCRNIETQTERREFDAKGSFMS